MERERVREEEPAQRDEGQHYEDMLRLNAEATERAKTGKIVIRAKDAPGTKADRGLRGPISPGTE